MATSPKGKMISLPMDHPMVGTICNICQEPVLGNQIPTVIGTEPERYFAPGPRMCAVNMKADPATTTLVHEACAYPE